MRNLVNTPAHGCTSGPYGCYICNSARYQLMEYAQKQIAHTPVHEHCFCMQQPYYGKPHLQCCMCSQRKLADTYHGPG